MSFLSKVDSKLGTTHPPEIIEEKVPSSCTDFGRLGVSAFQRLWRFCDIWPAPIETISNLAHTARAFVGAQAASFSRKKKKNFLRTLACGLSLCGPHNEVPR
jgi:hypothetical protein